jgi:hypothetical protein
MSVEMVQAELSATAEIISQDAMALNGYREDFLQRTDVEPTFRTILEAGVAIAGIKQLIEQGCRPMARYGNTVQEAGAAVTRVAVIPNVTPNEHITAALSHLSGAGEHVSDFDDERTLMAEHLATATSLHAALTKELKKAYLAHNRMASHPLDAQSEGGAAVSEIVAYIEHL